MIIKWSTKASKRLDLIYSFYLLDNEKTALKIYERLVKEVERLKSFPELAAREELLMNKTKVFRSLVVFRLFKVIYYVEDQFIVIADI